MKKLLVTGGAGFIGSSLIEKMEGAYDFYVLDNLSPQIHGKDYKNSFLYRKIEDKVTFIHGNITDKNSWEKLPKDLYGIIHLAAETGTGQSMYEIQRYSNVNISGTAIALEMCSTYFNDIQKFIVASSRAIYGEGRYKNPITNEIVFPTTRKEKDMEKGIFNPTENEVVLKMMPTTEDSLNNPVSVYGITKLSQEQLTMNVCASLGVSATALRFQNVYGPGQSLNNPYTGILSIFSKQLLKDKPINIFEDGLESRDFVYISDVVDSIILSLENQKAKGKIYNVGTGEATSVLEVAEILKKEYQSNSQISISGNYRVGDIRHNKADITNIQNDLGFNPKYSFNEGIKNFTEWVKTQNISESSYENSLEELKNKGLLKG